MRRLYFFVKVPEQMEEQAKLKKLAYSSPLELLSEKFHVDEELLKALNEGKDFEQAGTRITVPKVRAGKLGKVRRIEVDKEQKAVRAYDKDGQLLAYYPATVGSETRPAPSGSFEVTKDARSPLYTYEAEEPVQRRRSGSAFRHRAWSEQPRRHGLD